MGFFWRETMSFEIIILTIVSMNFLYTVASLWGKTLEDRALRIDINLIIEALKNNEKDRLEIINETIPDLQNDLNEIKSLVR
jgi:hypothetical protein